MRRFVCTEDGSNKFWEAAVDGGTLTTRWGKVGTAGQSKDKAFTSPEAAQKELEKLVREKVSKGYVEEGGASTAPIPALPTVPDSPKASGSPAPGSAAAPPLGKYTRALIAMLEEKPRRATVDAGFSAWAAAEKRPDLRALFTAMAAHTYEWIAVNDFNLTREVGRVPAPGDGPDRTDVIWLGATGGGDGYVVASPGSSKSRIQRVIHDEDWCDAGSWGDLEELLSKQVAAERKEQIAEGTEPGDVSIELETYIRAPGDDEERPLAGGRLTLAKGTGRRRDVRDVRDHWGGKSAPKEFSSFFYAERRWDYETVGDQDHHWHGRFTFASYAAPVEGTTKRVARAVLYDRGGAKPAWVAIDPPIVRTWGTDLEGHCSMAYGFSADGVDPLRLLVSGSRAIAFVDGKLVESGGTPVYAVTPPAPSGSLVCEGADDIAGVGWLGALVGVIRRAKKGNQLEIYEEAGGGWKLVRSVPCGKLDTILPFASGRAAMITKAKRGKVKTHVLAVRGQDVRLLGSLDGVLFQAYTLPEGQTIVSDDDGDNRWSELRHVDEAIADAFVGPPRDLVLA